MDLLDENNNIIIHLGQSNLRVKSVDLPDHGSKDVQILSHSGTDTETTRVTLVWKFRPTYVSIEKK